MTSPGPRSRAWCEGRTGYPSSTPGCASSPPPAGCTTAFAWSWRASWSRTCTCTGGTARGYFMDRLVDADLASNQHGWQWVAGSGTDAAPYFRVFNPVLQGIRFDPQGDYVRRWVPELGHLLDRAAHEPWSVPEGYVRGYPERIIEHDLERREALHRFGRLRSRSGPTELHDLVDRGGTHGVVPSRRVRKGT